MKPKTWAEANQRTVGRGVIEWDNDKLTEDIPVQLTIRPVIIAVDNATDVALTATLEHFLRIVDANASASIGEGESGVVTVEVAEAGVEGEGYFIEVVTTDDLDAALSVDIEDEMITVTLGTDGEGLPDDTKNTATLIAAAIDELSGFSAEASGTGDTAIDEAIDAKQFKGGTAEVWAEVVGTNGTPVSLTIPAGKKLVHGPITNFPRFRGGRIVITAATAPEEGETFVWVMEG